MREIGALIQWGWLYKKAGPSVRQSLATIPTATKFVHRREKFGAVVIVAFVARRSEPITGEAERSG
jgi:hypothetical protein